MLNWADRLRDQRNYTDLTTGCDTLPWCNSDYSRQLILWSIPLALSGQHYFAAEGRLALDPKTDVPTKLPFFTPTAFGTVQLLESERGQLDLDFGTLEFCELRIGKAALRRPVSLRVGGVRDSACGMTFCHRLSRMERLLPETQNSTSLLYDAT